MMNLFGRTTGKRSPEHHAARFGREAPLTDTLLDIPPVTICLEDPKGTAKNEPLSAVIGTLRAKPWQIACLVAGLNNLMNPAMQIYGDLSSHANLISIAASVTSVVLSATSIAAALCRAIYAGNENQRVPSA
jgi:hypothetical protein